MIESITPKIESICEYAVDAGQIIMSRYRQQNFTVTEKHDKSPVTSADIEAHHFLENKLEECFPVPVISEESYIESGSAPPQESSYWLIDPIDGTKEFINRSGDFTVNIALIVNRRPALGVVYAPLTEELYFAKAGHRAFKITNSGKTVSISTRTMSPTHFVCLVSHSHFSERLRTQIKSRWPDCELRRIASSLKFCKVAEGLADLYIRRGPTYEWDTGAAHCILEAAGGRMVNFDGESISYNKPGMKNDPFITYGDRSVNIHEFLF